MIIEKQIAIINARISLERRMVTLLNAKRTRRILNNLETKPKYMAEFWQIYNEGDVDKLKHWLHNRAVDITEMSIKQLRTIAQHEQVKSYYRLSKIELLQEIIHVRKRKNK